MWTGADPHFRTRLCKAVTTGAHLRAWSRGMVFHFPRGTWHVITYHPWHVLSHQKKKKKTLKDELLSFSLLAAWAAGLPNREPKFRGGGGRKVQDPRQIHTSAPFVLSIPNYLGTQEGSCVRESLAGGRGGSEGAGAPPAVFAGPGRRPGAYDARRQGRCRSEVGACPAGLRGPFFVCSEDPRWLCAQAKEAPRMLRPSAPSRRCLM